MDNADLPICYNYFNTSKVENDIEILKYMRKGFTLIEILIVVAIIAILASIVLVGLGPSQQAGRDARRLSDIRQIQTGLELYFNRCGIYPGNAAPNTAGQPCTVAADDYHAMVAAVTGSNLGISSMPQDPSPSQTYYYGVSATGNTYTVGAHLENTGNTVFNNYTTPTLLPSGFDCTAANNNYCVSQ